jgi:single-strand DNA-binding protein
MEKIMNTNNMCIITGYVGNNPESIQTKTGMITTLSIASNEYKKDENTNEYVKTHTNWLDVKAFGNLSERAISEIKKGDLITVYGSLRTSIFDSRNGIRKKSTEIIATEIVQVKRVKAEA